MTTVILAFDESDYDEPDTLHSIYKHQHGPTQPARLWLAGRKAGKVAMAKHRLPFEDSIEGQVIVAMKQGVIDAVVEAVRVRVASGEELKPQELYAAAVKALDEVEKLQDSLDSRADSDSDTE